jgi:hypothetical protein
MSPFYCPHLLLVFTSFITPFCESIRILTRSTLPTLPTLQAKQRLWPLVVLYEKKPNATGGSELDEEISGSLPASRLGCICQWNLEMPGADMGSTETSCS